MEKYEAQYLTMRIAHIIYTTAIVNIFSTKFKLKDIYDHVSSYLVGFFNFRTVFHVLNSGLEQ